mmetsp:Transcript_118782/g.331385  ORF Transcript_118782/g.331385 Transcript_118782/m.331385 type:complete len:263 (-) Transcript_118782:1218-2006(-)
MMASVSFQFARFEELTNFSKSFVMMLPTVVRKESACKRRNSSRARVQSVVPPPEARRRASAMRPLLKQHSTAAGKLPTRMDCLMMDSGPADQSVAACGPPLLAPALAAPKACSVSFFCSRSISSFFFCSVLEASSSKKLSTCVRSNSARAGDGWAEPALCSLAFSSGGGPMRVVPGCLPRKRSASCTIRSLSKPKRMGTRWRPVSSNCEPMSSHISVSWVFCWHRFVFSWQYSRSRCCSIQDSNRSALGTTSGSLGTMSEWQ